jgi:hypothetical protein
MHALNLPFRLLASLKGKGFAIYFELTEFVSMLNIEWCYYL